MIHKVVFKKLFNQPKEGELIWDIAITSYRKTKIGCGEHTRYSHNLWLDLFFVTFYFSWQTSKERPAYKEIDFTDPRGY